MNEQKRLILSQLLVMLAMVLLIFDEIQDPRPTALRIFGIDWWILSATGVILIGAIIIAYALRTQPPPD